MGYRIECDRCGDTQRVDGSTAIPQLWLQFNDLARGDGQTATEGPIKGGVFCRSCADDLARWRREPPVRAAPYKAA